MQIFTASNQWAKRPNDERFWGLQDGFAACAAYRAQAREKTVQLNTIRVENFDGDLGIVGKARIPANLTHWAFGQVSKLVGAPAGYLRGLPGTLAAQNLNHGLKTIPDSVESNLLFHQNGSLVLRSALTDSYFRIWNDEVFERLLELPEGWRVPPARPAREGDPRTRPATERDVLQNAGFDLSVKVGDEIAPAGVYVSDHDCFAFLVNEEKRIDDGTDDGLSRGIMVSNSEVGGGAFWATGFYFDAVCGNHIVHGVSNLVEVKVRHVGAKARDKAFEGLEVEFNRFSDASSKAFEGVIVEARKLVLGADAKAVLETVFGLVSKQKIDLTRKIITSGFDRAVEREDRYGDPKTLWAVVNGITEVSQETGFADERVKIDRAAGKLLRAAF